jgi:phage gpG-like protein
VKLDVVIRGEREVAATIEGFADRLQARLVRTMTRLGVELQRKVKSEKLSGQVLKNRTGHLRASITAQTTPTDAGVTTEVGIFQGPTLVYGRVHEFGFTGTVNVREHVRQSARGARAALRKAARKAPNDPYLAAAPSARHTVRAHTRQVDFPARSFLRTAFAEFSDTIVTVIAADVAEAGRA